MIFLLLNILFNLILWVYLGNILHPLFVYLTLIIIKALQLYYGNQIYCKIYSLAENQFIYLENLDYKLKLKAGKFIFNKIQKYIFPLMLKMNSTETVNTNGIDTDSIDTDSIDTDSIDTNSIDTEVIKNMNPMFLKQLTKKEISLVVY